VTNPLPGSERTATATVTDRLVPSDVDAPGDRPGARQRRLRLLGLFFALVALSALLRIPTFGNHVFNSDEAYLATEAQVLEHGGHLYTDAVDRKPPLVPYLYAAAFETAGTDDLVSVRVLAVLAHALTALLIAVEAQRRLRRNWTGIAAAILYLFGATAFRPQDAQAANFEVFMLPVMTAAMLLGIRRRRGGAGATLAIATLAKQTAATTLLPLAWLAWRARRARGLVLLAASFVIPILAVAAVMGFHDFFFWVFTGNGGYLDASGVLGYALGLGARQTAWFVVGHVVIIGLAVLAWPSRREDADLWLWAASGAVAVVIGLRFFPHYYLQMLPPLCLLAARGVTSTIWRTRRWALVGLSVVLLGTGGYYLVTAFLHTNGRDGNIATSAARYVADHSGPESRVLVWGHAPEVYWESGRRPATRFVTTGFLTGASGARPPDRVGMQYATPGAWTQFLDDLRRHPPTLIVDMSEANQRNARFYPPSRFPPFARYLANGNWRRVAVVDGAGIYRRSNN
jgi:hypothetical protein